MGNLEPLVGEIQAIIEQMRRAIPSGRFFEFGVNTEILELIENYLIKIRILVHSLDEVYASKSLGEIKLYSDAATALSAFQDFVKEVRDKESGSKEYTSRIRTLINELDNSIALLAHPNARDVEGTGKSVNEKNDIISGPTTLSELQAPDRNRSSSVNQSIFISYAWGDEREEIVNQIDKALQKRGLRITRDKRDLGYKGSIREFMERIGKGNCVIVVVSDKYLRSQNCMFEMVEIAENKQFHDRIFPIVLTDADIYDPVKRLEYVKHWEVKRAELAAAMQTVDPANLQGIRDDIDLYSRIRDKISGLTSILKDMNTLTPDMHRDSNFRQLYDAIEKKIKSSQTYRHSW